MPDNTWQEAAKAADLEEGAPVMVKVEKRSVLLVRLRGKVYAMGAKCPHYGAPLEKGVLIDHVLTCPWHNARFDVTRGCAASPPALDDPAGYEVKEEGNEVLVRKVVRKSRAVSTTEDTRFVVLGGGAAGCAAVLALREADFAGRITMITAEEDLPDRPALSKGYMDGSEDPKWLPLRGPEFYETAAVETMTGRRARSLDRKERIIHLSDGTSQTYDRLLLATGSKPRTPTIDGAGTDRVFLLRSYEDARRIVDALEGAGRAVIIGASFIGLEVAASLRKRDIDVHVVAPEEVLMEKVFGGPIGKFLQRVHEEEGVCFSLGVHPKQVRRGAKGGVEVAAEDGSVISGDLVIAGIGVEPAVGFLQDSGLVENGAVPVDETLKTRDENVWAAGDIALIPDFITGGTRRIEHWVEAERQGRHAARSMLGLGDAYREVPFFWTKQHDTVIRYVGHGAGYDDIRYRGEVESGTCMAGFFKEKRLVAAASLGMDEDVIVAGEIIRGGTSLTPEQFEDTAMSLREIFGK
jgi:NADPH-dependent 2,4-dienoyl-CoA reductase/sulfur reductase-like enzyme/nitrite reductase/ring-hydroxylating ferredoxin subunit